jgi:predicted MFS family arabinose efflux permease
VNAFYGLGWLIGLPLGTYIKTHLGYVPLFSFTLILALGTILYVMLFVKDSYHLLSDQQKITFDAERDTNQLHCDRGNILP